MTVTAWVLIGAASILVAYDIIAAIERRATISVTLYEWGKKYPVIPFGIGVILGHIFWST